MAEKTPSYPLLISENDYPTPSLRDLSRQCIISCLSLRPQCTQQVGQLPLPSLVKDFLMTFRVPEDFDTRGANIEYHSSFPSHWHHDSHQVHPATCNLNGSKVLLAYVDPLKNCMTCEATYSATVGMYAPDNRKELVSLWCGMNHTNLMNCILNLVDVKRKWQVYVLEFPVMNLRDFVDRASCAKMRVPDFLVWETLSKLTSVLLYLAEQGVIAWDLCQLEHVVLVAGGEVKLENLLLYQPAMVAAGVCLQSQGRSCHPWPLCFAPELRWGKVGPAALVWGLGFIVHELVKPLQCVPVKKAVTQDARQTPTNRFELSASLTRLTSECFRPHPLDRPSLEDLHQTACTQAKKAGQGYSGPRTLLELVELC